MPPAGRRSVDPRRGVPRGRGYRGRHVAARHRPRTVRRRPPRLLRGPGGRGRGDAVPPPGRRRARRPRGAAARRRRALLRPRRTQPDQRPQPRPHRAAARRARPPRHRHPRRLGQPQQRAVLRRRGARVPRPRCLPGGRAPHQRLLLLLLVPPVPREPRRGRRRRSARPPTAWSSTRSVRTSATPASARRGPGPSSLALEGLDEPGGARLLFVTHSVPTAMDETSGPGDGEGHLYVDQHLRLVHRLVDDVNAALGTSLTGELVFCSRSGPPQQPWLEPDVNDRIEELAAEGDGPVVVAPIGFVSDHMEVVQDLDTEAAETARRVGPALRPGRDARHRRGLRQRPGRPAARACRRGPGRGRGAGVLGSG